MFSCSSWLWWMCGGKQCIYLDGGLFLSQQQGIVMQCDFISHSHTACVMASEGPDGLRELSVLWCVDFPCLE